MTTQADPNVVSNNQDVISKNRGILFAQSTGDTELDEILQCIRNVDWSSTRLGPLEEWPSDLLQLCHVALLDTQPRLLNLGPDRRMLYNGAGSKIFGDKHPHMMGLTVEEAWGDAPETIEPLDSVATSGREHRVSEHFLTYARNGFLEEVILSWTTIPLIGSTEGFYISLVDVTETRLGEKRRSALRTLDSAWNLITDSRAFWQSIPRNIPTDRFLFHSAVLYAAIPDSSSDSAIDITPETTEDLKFRLEGATRDTDLSMLPQNLKPEDFKRYAYLQQIMTTKEPVLIKRNNQPIFHNCPSSQNNTLVCPISSNRSSKVIALLYLDIDVKRPYNETHQAWIHEFTQFIGNAATSVLLAEEEKRMQHTTAKQAAQEQHVLATALATRNKEAIAVSDQFSRILKLVDMAGVGVFEYDPDGRLLFSNDAFCAMSGYSRETQDGDTLAFMDLINPKDTEWILEKWRTMVSGIPVSFEMQWAPVKPDIEGTWVLAACVPVMDENGVVVSISGCITDFTAQKNAEVASRHRVEALERAKASEQKFAKFAESSPVAIYFSDAATGQLTYCNPAWFAMTGHPQVPFNEISWETTVYEEDIQSVKKVWSRIVDEQEATNTQFRLRRRWVDNNGAAIGPLYVTASALPEFGEDGRIKGVVVTMQDISALKFGEILQKARLDEAIEAKRQQENFIDMTSHEIRNPLGAVSICSDSVLETLSDMDKIAKSLLITSEYGTGKQLQELVNTGVDAISTVISCSAHQRRIVDDILVLSKLDSNLLQIAPSAVKVNSLLHEAEKMFQAEAEKNQIDMILDIDSSIKELNVDWALLDPGRVQQVLINLVTNAIKFTKKRPTRTVTIRMGANKERPSENLIPVDFVVARSLFHDESEFELNNFYLWFSVQDTGRGMTAEEKGKIFARFTQGSPMTYNEYGGSGLGLFISRELSELQGGEIGVASEIDVGSTFAFFVKTRHAQAPVTARLALQSLSLDPAAESSSAKTSVLVVEDNAVNQRVLKKQLSKLGYDVSVADNGQDAIDFVKTTRHWRSQPLGSKDISVILMDVNMPIMDGLTATKMIREYEKDGQICDHIPIIAVSANARAEQTKQAIDAGMDDSIAKPFRIADLVPKIDRLAGWARALGP